MADLAPSGTATLHTIKRHREILMVIQVFFGWPISKANLE